ncbi:hypothetical protein PFISCL1PPCAC_26709, partial [Pristionchus fissidentatus]
TNLREMFKHAMIDELCVEIIYADQKTFSLILDAFHLITYNKLNLYCKGTPNSIIELAYGLLNLHNVDKCCIEVKFDLDARD